MALLAHSGIGYQYSWKKNNVTIPGATAITYTATQAGKCNWNLLSRASQ